MAGAKRSKKLEILAKLQPTVARLLDAGEHLPPSLRQDIIALGDAATASLIAVLGDDDLSYEHGPGGGWAPIHAVDLLAELRAVEAIQPMLQVLARTEWETILHDRIIITLPKLGQPVLEPALAAYAEATNPDLRGALAGIMSRLGVRDERVFSILVELLGEDTELGAMELAEYGDPRAVEHLSRALDAATLEDEGSPFANQDVIELREAIIDLGGILSPSQQHTFEAVLRLRRQSLAALRADSDPSWLPPSRRDSPGPPGRNDPCWCGSGKKYKKCHLHADQQGSD